MLTRRTLAKLCICTGALQAIGARAEEAPDALILRMSNGVLDAVRADPAIQEGDLRKVLLLVDELVMPNVNFRRMTASALGRHWRQATAEQQQRLEAEFKMLLIRSYAGALTQVKDQTVQLKPMRTEPGGEEVVVRSEVVGKGAPVELDYRLERTTGTWKIYDINVLGLWMVDNYRSSFAQEISASGIDGLIAKLAERNRAAAVGH
ncbi:MAG: ABC transporter substrate-binding protein [Ideonella sp.]|nr:ABC transporter substrate-binding protein [Pseudomonadota bacterium]MBK6862970.1 ABC transporter substrate-binding protein [Ideonella sp.]